MFTLQILDRGQTSLHPLAEQPVSLGSAADVDIRLAEEGVAPRHVTIHPAAGECRLEAGAPVFVNGEATTSCALRLGDRLELGRAVVVIGRTVARAANAEDVIADAPVRTRRQPKRRSRPWLPIAAAVGVTGLLGWLITTSGDGSTVNGELARIARLRESAHLDEVAAGIARLRTAWARATDDRLQRLDHEHELLQQIEAAEARLRSAVLAPDDHRTYNEWHRELERLEHEGAAEERIAARVLRGNLRETIERRPQVAHVEAPSVPTSPNASPTNPGAATHASTSSGPTPVVAQADVAQADVAPAPGGANDAAIVAPTTPSEAWRAAAEEATRLGSAGQFARASAVLQSAAGDVPDQAAAAAVRAQAARLHGDAVAALGSVLQEAKARLDGGDAVAAKALLTEARGRFPVAPEFAALDEALDRAVRTIAAARQPASPTTPPPVDAAVRTATLASLRGQMDAIRAAEERAAFAEAKELLAAAAVAVRERDPDFATRLEARAAEAGLIATFQATLIMALQAGKKAPVTTVAGARVTLAAVEGDHLLGAAAGGDQRVGWTEFSAEAIEDLVVQLAMAGDAPLGAATMLYKRGEAAAAERILAAVLRGDADGKPAIDQVIARGRGEPFDPRGYTLGKDGFVSARTTAVQVDAKKLLGKLESVLRDNNPAAREAFATEALAAGTDGAASLAAALNLELQKQIAKLEASPLRKQVDRLAAQRVQLDAARQHAKELIFDEVKYFYPYKPPAVSGEKYTEYNRVQKEVDERVTALRTVWSDDRIKLRVPANLRADLGRLDWLARVLGELGALDQSQLAAIEWARALPPGDTVTVRDYAETVAERDELAEWRAIEAYDEIVAKKLGSAQRELLRITNEYRAMFRHRPLAIVLTCSAASQGHADEMSKLGYFAHMSPTPGRKTPYDRMRLAGYEFGVSENIALVDGAMGAHVAWCHSSGHHRNLLDASHTEIGIGNAGRYWVQNFGSGSVYRNDPAWQQARAPHKN